MWPPLKEFSEFIFDRTSGVPGRLACCVSWNHLSFHSPLLPCQADLSTKYRAPKLYLDALRAILVSGGNVPQVLQNTGMALRGSPPVFSKF